jgi:hypothetical protein
MQILCRLLGHRRNKRRITQWRESWQTECLMCSTRLVRMRRGKWVPVSSFEHSGPARGLYRTTPAD